MKNFVTGLCADHIAQRRLTKKDLEGFLSAFKYSKHGATDAASIAPLVFEKDANQLTLKMACRVRTNPPPAFVNQDLGQDEPSADIKDEATARRLRGLLGEIENVAFQGGKNNTYKVFRAFDEDGDGYVSYKDFEEHLRKNKVQSTKEDLNILMKKVLDTDGNGFIDLKTFQSKFGPNMSK